MIFLFSAFLLSRRARWDFPFTLVTLVCGTIPLVSFWAEHRATRRVRAEHPELRLIASLGSTHDDRVRPRRRRRPGRRRGRHAAGAARARHRPRPRARHQRRRPQRRDGRPAARARGRSTGSPTCGSPPRRARDVYGDRPLRTVRRAVSTGTHIYSSEPLRARLEEELGDATFEDLPVRVRGVRGQHRARRRALVHRAGRSCRPSSPAPPCPACSRRPIETEYGVSTSSTAGWSTPSRSGGRSSSAPTRVFVLQVGRIDRPLQVPTRPWEVARVSFEVARRHRFMRDMATIPDGVEAHVLPAAGTSSTRRLAARPPRLLGRAAPHRRDVRRLAGLTSTRSSAGHEAPARVGPPSAGGGPGGGRPDRADVGDPPGLAAGGRGALAGAARAAGGRCGCCGWCCSTSPSRRCCSRCCSACGWPAASAGGSARPTSPASTTTSCSAR